MSFAEKCPSSVRARNAPSSSRPIGGHSVLPPASQRQTGNHGLGPINYKYGETVEDAIVKLEYDLYYIKNLSLSLDMYIIFNTLKAMLVTQSGQ